MEHLGYALRAEYEGTVDVELEDGSTQERPVFGGGLLAVGDGDFDVAKELARGDGTIVVQGNDQTLIELLNVYPALKRVKAPDDASPVSPYTRRTVDALRQDAQLREVDSAASLGRAGLIRALEAHDAQVYGDPPPAEPDELDPVDDDAPPIAAALTTPQLIAVLDVDTDAFADAGKVDVPAAIAALQVRASTDTEAADALASRNLERKE